MIGDYAVGKTSIIKRYTEGYFTPNYKLTIGVDFAVKAVEWDEKTVVSLQVGPPSSSHLTLSALGRRWSRALRYSLGNMLILLS